MEANAYPPLSLLAVIVLYCKRLEEAPSFAFLKGHLEQPASDGFKLRKVLVYDNTPSPEPFQSPVEGEGILYVHDPRNGGTRAAYAEALRIAEDLKIEWLLLLDHDTHLPEDFLDLSHAALSSGQDCMPPPAIVPRIIENGRQLSPLVMSPTGRTIPMSLEVPKRLAISGASAFSTGAIMRVNAFHAIQPIPERFWLDFLDHWMFRALTSRFGAPLASMACIEHELSLNRLATIREERYRSFLSCEHAFLKEDPRFSKVAYATRCTTRLFSLLIQRAPLKILRAAFLHLVVSIFGSPDAQSRT